MREKFEHDSDQPSTQSNLPGELETTGARNAARGRRRIVWILALLAFFGVVVWFVPPVYFLVNGPVTVTRWEKKKGKTQATVGPGRKDWISAKKISRHVLNAVVVAEDGRFYQHPGLDFEAIRAAYQFNKRRGRYARGGSTITQQVVKMAFLEREKTLIRKAREATGALLLELILPKDRILEWYLNLAEFGDSVYGIKDGAWHYFKTKPEQISIEQAVHLALVLPSPNAWSRGLRRRELTGFGHKRYAGILLGMRQSGYITQAQWTTGITRGNFGRPINGYAALLAAEAKGLCAGDLDADAKLRAGCPEDVVNGAEAEAAGDDGSGEPAGTSPTAATPSDAAPAATPGAVPVESTVPPTPSPTNEPPPTVTTPEGLVTGDAYSGPEASPLDAPKAEGDSSSEAPPAPPTTEF